MPSPATPATGLAATGLTAEQVVREREGGPVVALRRVEISQHGSRITNMGIADGDTWLGSSQILANDALERLWLIDRARRVVHRVPLVSTDVPVGGAPADPADAPSRTGEVFAFAPCEGLSAGDPVPSRWRGRAVTVHACSDETGRLVSHQAFDAEAGIVVRVVADGAPVHEVRAIRALALGPERFVPDDSLREVTLEAFLNGPEPLAPYVDG